MGANINRCRCATRPWRARRYAALVTALLVAGSAPAPGDPPDGDAAGPRPSEGAATSPSDRPAGARAAHPSTPGRAARARGKPGKPDTSRTVLLDEIWRELSTHDPFFDPADAALRQRFEDARTALRALDDENERLREIVRFLGTFEDGHLHLTTRWFLPDKPAPPLPLAGDAALHRPAPRWTQLRRDYFVRTPDELLPADARRVPGASPEYARIVAIDGAPPGFGGWSLLNGPKDTIVELLLERPSGERVRWPLKRTEPVVPPKHFAPTTQRVVVDRDTGETKQKETEIVVEWRCLDDGVGYLRVAHLVTTQVIADFHAALDQLLDTDGLILDLRNTHGGYPWIMMPLAGRFYDSYQKVCSFSGRSPLISGVVRSVGQVGIPPVGKPYRGTLVVLINGNTASMSEGLAFSLGDTGRAVLVGQPTRGLGAAIRNTTLSNGLVLWHSWIQVNRLDGTQYQNVGVEPHVLVQLSDDEVQRLGPREAARVERRMQLDRALEVLRERIRVEQALRIP
ncbi:MAG: S41 family peptidase [Phycisphaerae bacterium]